MPTYIVNDCAEADLDQIADYISEDSLDAAIHFYQAARQVFNRIFEFPRAGTLHPVKNPAYALLRVRPIKGFRKFLVCYVATEEKVEILRVVHGARDVRRVFS